jgi:hypothetical protein
VVEELEAFLKSKNVVLVDTVMGLHVFRVSVRSVEQMGAIRSRMEMVLESQVKIVLCALPKPSHEKKTFMLHFSVNEEDVERVKEIFEQKPAFKVVVKAIMNDEDCHSASKSTNKSGTSSRRCMRPGNRFRAYSQSYSCPRRVHSLDGHGSERLPENTRHAAAPRFQRFSPDRDSRLNNISFKSMRRTMGDSNGRFPVNDNFPLSQTAVRKEIKYTDSKGNVSYAVYEREGENMHRVSEGRRPTPHPSSPQPPPRHDGKAQTYSDVCKVDEKMKKDHMKQYSPSQISSISDDHLQYLSIGHIQSLTEKQVQALQPQQIKRLSGHQISYLTPEQIKYLGQEQIQCLTREQIPHITKEQLKSIKPDQIPHLDQNQIPYLTAYQIRVLTRDQIKALIPRQISYLTNDQVPFLSDIQIPVLSEEQIPAILPKQMPALTARQISSLKPEQIPYLQK